MCATTLFSDKAHRMGVIHHHQGIVLICEITDTLQIRDDPIHGKHTVRGNQFGASTRLIGRLQLRFEIRHIVVGITVARRFAKTYPVDNRSMIQRI